MSFYLLDFIFLIFEETATKSVTLVEGSLPPTTKCKNPNNFSKYFQKVNVTKQKKYENYAPGQCNEIPWPS